MRTSFQICILSIVALFVGVAAPRVNAQCSADLNADLSVTAQDLAIMLAFWGPTTTFAAADINQDQIVNAQDLAMLLAGWGPCPPADLSWATVLEQDPNPAVVTDANFLQRMIATGLPWRVRDTGTGIEMLLVPGGTFMMGCGLGFGECSTNDLPAHQVTLTQAFYMGKTEVTQAQWTATMGSNPSFFVAGNGYPGSFDRPVEQVSWDTIQIFNSVTGLRLPTEAEWEYAYRAGTTTAFHSFPAQPTGFNFNDGSLPDNIMWYDENAGSQTHAAGGKYANALGLHDMSGNVLEWCQDWHRDYSSGSATNPTGPTTGGARLLRGGDWGLPATICTSSQRFGIYPAYANKDIGFRVARNP
jgi:formylglycine-generating enzyme required for sulfatase activity